MSKKEKVTWPLDCIWPEPVCEGFGSEWEIDDIPLMAVDEDVEELLEIREYFDELVKDGILNEDYSHGDDTDDEWEPERGTDYWDDGFDLEGWEYDLLEHVNLLKLPYPNPVGDIQQITGYEFVNENLLRQAFMRRSFAIKHNIGDCERLEFVGDAVLEMAVTKEMTRQIMDEDVIHTEGPLVSKYSEGDFTKIRSRFVSKEHLATRATKLGLNAFILYGEGEEETESSREDMMEALIGAVAIDSKWNWSVIESVIDRLVCIQLSRPDEFLKETYYDLFNAWHQRHFGFMPKYDLTHHGNGYYCTLRYNVPENHRGVDQVQRLDIDADTRSGAREAAARRAYGFVVNNGLWINLEDAHIIPSKENSINQLQELFQKKYTEKAVYEFEERGNNEWYCSCVCSGVEGFGKGKTKTEAKKKSSYMVLVRLLSAAGIRNEEWRKEMYRDYRNC